MTKRVTFFTLILLAVSGCANTQSIYRKYDIQKNGPNSVVVDAKQRAINSVDRKASDDIRVCSEPPPDAVSAISSAFSAAGGNGQVQAQLGAALTEAVGKLTKRNATVELLRYFAFSHCQAYASDGISKTSYEQGLEQIADLSVTLLAIEQVTSPNAGESPLALTAGKSGVTLTYTPPPASPGTNPDTNAEDDPPAGDNPAPPGDQPPSTPPDDQPPPAPEDSATGNDESDGTREDELEEQLAGREQVKTPVGALSTTLTAGEGAVLQVGTAATNTVSQPVAEEVRRMLANTLTKRLQNECLRGLIEIIENDSTQRASQNTSDPAIPSSAIRRELLNELNAKTTFINACQAVLTDGLGIGEPSGDSAVPAGEEATTPSCSHCDIDFRHMKKQILFLLLAFVFLNACAGGSTFTPEAKDLIELKFVGDAKRDRELFIRQQMASCIRVDGQLCVTPEPPPTMFPVRRYLKNSTRQNRTLYALHEDYRYYDHSRCFDVTIPRYFAWELASIPKGLRTFFNPQDFPESSLVHDWLYALGVAGDESSRRVADEIYHEINIANGIKRSTSETQFQAITKLGESGYGLASDFAFFDPQNPGIVIAERPDFRSAQEAGDRKYAIVIGSGSKKTQIEFEVPNLRGCSESDAQK